MEPRAPPGSSVNVPVAFFFCSQGVGNGLVGVGWSLSGLASIGRCAQTMAQDGVRGAITYTTNDRFCLDGQRLVAISGSYGADGTEYRTEIDSFSRIISHGTAGNGPAWFEVHTKAGQIMQFGNTTDSFIFAQGTATARNWGLNKVSDTKGDYLSVKYTNNTSSNPSVGNGEAYPSEIDYTANDAAGLTAYNKVTFSYQTRTDQSTLYQAGSVIGSTMRLTDVMTYANGSLVADYRLGYQYSASTSASEVISITLYASDGTSLPATAVGWLTGFDGTFTASSATYGSLNFGMPPQNEFLTISGDFNGDGKTDWSIVGSVNQYVFLSNGDGTFSNSGPLSFGGGTNFGTPPTQAHFSFVGDFNGDGKTDWMMASGTTSDMFLSNGDGTFNKIIKTGAFGGSDFGTPAQNQNLLFSGDFNGDGRTDLALLANATMDVYLSNGDGTFTHVGPNSYGGPTWGTPPQSLRLPIVGDFDGDGKTDWMMVSGTTQWVYLSNGNGTFTKYETDNAFGGSNFQSPPQNYYLSIVGDFNGDGKTDWAMAYNTTLFVFLSKGNGLFTKIEIDNAFGGASVGSPPSQEYQMLSGDFNGDGKTDFTMVGSANQIVFLGVGNGEFTRIGFESFGGPTYGFPPQQNYALFTGDFNGDGKTDWSSLGGATQWVYLAHGPIGDFAQTVTTGLGATTTITNQPLTQSSVYTKDTTAVYPTQDLQGPMYVVSRVDAPTGISGTSYSATYSYVGAKSISMAAAFSVSARWRLKTCSPTSCTRPRTISCFPISG
jgi:FG-GAP-like repeat